MKIQILNNKLIQILVSSFLMGLSQHPLNLGFLSWISLIPFIHILNSVNCYKKIIFYSFSWGLLYNLFTVFWLAFNIGTAPLIAFISMLLAILILSSSAILVGILWFRLSKFYSKNKLLLFPLVWVSIEYIRSYGILGFPWISLANSQTDYLYLIQNAEFVGIYGISFWIVLLNIYIYKILQKTHLSKNYYTLILIFILPWLTGHYLYKNTNQEIDKNIKISIVQPNINLISKRDYDKRFKNLNNLILKSKECINSGSDLIIWPESALPYNNLQESETLNYIIENLLIENDTYLLTGNVIYDSKGHFNSSVLLNKHGIQKIYNKQLLVPVAEYVPMSDWFPIFKTFNFGQANFSKGIKDVLFEVNNQKFSSLICFESTFPEINRRHAKNGADFFTYIVNDGWYTSPPQPQQHMQQSIYRAIENRKTVLRCANTGISAVIDPNGEVREKINLNNEGVITSFIKKTNKSTFYTNYGNVFAIIMLIIICILFGKTFIKNEQKI